MKAHESMVTGFHQAFSGIKTMIKSKIKNKNLLIDEGGGKKMWKKREVRINNNNNKNIK